MNTNEWGEPSGEPDFELDASGYDGEGLDRGGDTVNLEGWYHFEIVDVQKELGTLNDQGHPKSPSILFICQVLKTVEKQSPRGCKLYHRAYLAGKGGEPIKKGSLDNTFRFGVGLGLLRTVDNDGAKTVVNAKTGLPKIPSDLWLDAKGKQFIGQVVLEKGTEGYKDKYVLDYNRPYPVDHPKVANIAKDAEALAMIGMSNAAPPAGSPQGQQGQPAAPPVVAAAVPDDLAGL